MRSLLRALAVAVSVSISVSVSGLQAQTCDNGGLKLPKGFCATVFADSLGAARHLVVAPNGDVFVAIRNGRSAKGGVIALRDTTRDGRADMRVRFGDNGGIGIALRGTNLYFGTDGAILRYMLPAGNLLPHTTVDTVVGGLPAAGGHVGKTIALGRGNDLFVNIGSRTNSCQVQDRQNESPGVDPCTELETRAGIWRFDASKRNQAQSNGERFATGLRNVVAVTTDAAGTLYGVQNGRDQLFQNWPKLFTAEQSAEKPAEIFVQIQKGDDYGWPYCYYDGQLRRNVLAPEYGGDGKTVGRCASIKAPMAAYPAHSAPLGLVFYSGTQFPARFRGGAFIAFHGSWNRAPLPQGGNNVMFQPMKNGVPSGEAEIFAEGFSPPGASPQAGPHRATGVAVGPDGSLYISDDAGGRIWRVTYRGE
jgi:glucose/arabinose dehydrogenase